MMKPAVKISSLLLAVVMLISVLLVSGCSLGKEWSYKTSDKELSIGVYIYALKNSYAEALSYAKKADDYDGTKSDWLDKEITDDDGNKAVARQWIKDKAEETCLQFLALEKVVKDEGASIDEATIEAYNEQAKTYWEVGPYSSYGYVMPYRDEYEPYGVSYESYRYCMSDAQANYSAAFKALYEKGGSKEVSDEELIKFVNENYTSYNYFQVDLTEASTDEAGESKTVALSDEKAKEILDQLDGYVKDVDKGTKFDDIVSKYMESSGLTESPASPKIEDLEKSSLGDDVKEAIKKLENGKAAVVKVGEGDSAIAYLVYKDDITKGSEEYIADESNRSSALSAMKTDEFKDYLKKVAEDSGYEKNGAVDSYDPKMFFAAEEPTTTAEESSDDKEDESSSEE